MTTTAAAPSEICEDEAAVIVPSAVNAGRRALSASAVVSGRTPSSVSNTTGSPRRRGTGTPTISPASRPSLMTLAARWCDCAENSSCSARLIPSLVLCRSVSSPIGTWPNASVRPSQAIASSSSMEPYLCPARDPGSRCGAPVMDSMPPAITTSNSPARMSCAASAIASSPDRHTLLIVIDGTDIGMPAATAACRAGFCPAPAWSTWPMIT